MELKIDLKQPVKTPGGRDVTTTGDFKAMAAVPQVANSFASTLVNLIPIDILIPIAVSVALRVATQGTGTRSKRIKDILIQVAKGIDNEFPGNVC